MDGQIVWNELLEGNRRFREGRRIQDQYDDGRIDILKLGQQPVAAVITCCDSRVAPEILFDQPLGRLFVNRQPGNLANEGAKWMIDIAIRELMVPLVVILGHTECLAIGQVLRGELSGAGASLRSMMAIAVARARQHPGSDFYRQAVVDNALLTTEHLLSDSSPLRSAVHSGTCLVMTALYDIATGIVHPL
jgi:carbonic anhydrase